MLKKDKQIWPFNTAFLIKLRELSTKQYLMWWRILNRPQNFFEKARELSLWFWRKTILIHIIIIIIIIIIPLLKTKYY